MRRSAARQCAQGARSEPRSLLYRRQGRGAQGGAQAACDAIGAIARRRKRRGLPQTRSRVGGSKNSSGMRTPHLGVTPKLGSSECVERVSSGCAAWWHAMPHIYVCVSGCDIWGCFVTQMNFTEFQGITSSPRAYQRSPGTALEMGSWLEQKIAAGKLFIQKYSIKYAFERVQLGASRAHFGARRGPTRPIREALGLPSISTCTVTNAPASRKRSLT